MASWWREVGLCVYVIERLTEKHLRWSVIVSDNWVSFLLP